MKQHEPDFQSKPFFVAAHLAWTSGVPQRVRRVITQRYDKLTYPGIIQCKLFHKLKVFQEQAHLCCVGLKQSGQCTPKSFPQRFSSLDFVYFPVLYKSARKPRLRLNRVLFVSWLMKSSCRNGSQFGASGREKKERVRVMSFFDLSHHATCLFILPLYCKNFH